MRTGTEGHRDSLRLVAGLALAAAGACSTQPIPELSQPAPQVAAPQPAAPQGPTDPSKLLEGRWEVVLTLDPLSMQSPPPTERITGEIAFGSSAWWGSSDRFGRHSVDLRPFFGRTLARPDGIAAFSAGDTSMVTEVSGSVTGDSVGIDFIPRIDHIGLSFWGRFYGDSATGRWRRRGMDGSGHFWLRRVSKEPVSVAAIPVYTRIGATPAATTTVASATPTPAADAKSEKGAAKASAKGTTAKGKTSKPSAATTLASTTAKTTKPSSPASQPTTTVASSAQAKPQQGTVTTASAGSVATQPTQPTAIAATQPTATQPTPTPSATTALTTKAQAAPTQPPATQRAATTTPAASSSPAPAPGLTQNLSTASARPTPAAVPTTPAADPKAMGTIRVRTHDVSSDKYFATKYSLHLPDGRWMYGTLRTGAAGEGWGNALPRMPGRYEIEITDFVCGDKIWFLKDKILKTVEVRPGEPADITIDLDVANVPARKSLDNPTGAKCTAGPGAAR